MPKPHPHDIPPTDHHPEDCPCLVCYCKRLVTVKSAASKKIRLPLLRV